MTTSQLHAAIAARLLVWPRPAKLALAMTADAAVAVFALFAAIVLLGPQPTWAEAVTYAWAALAVALLTPVVALFAGTYRAVTRVLHVSVLWRVAAVSLGMIGLLLAVAAAFGQAQAWNHVVVFGLVLVMGLTFWRVAAARLLGGHRLEGKGTPVAIYGAGSAGQQLATALTRGHEFRPVAFIDDHPDLHRRFLSGLRVYAPRDVERLQRRGVRRVLLAIPSITRQRRKQILEDLGQHAMSVMVMPRVDELAHGSQRIDDLREVQIEDLLGRDPVKPDVELMRAFNTGKNVLITGGGGSIGAELARQVLQLGARKLVLLDISEYALYEIERQLLALQRDTANGRPHVDIVPVLGSVMDGKLLRELIARHGIQTVYHAAAYKHVPLVQSNAIAGIRNNLFGTQMAVEAAAECGVGHFVLVSTDKAVRPTNVMGASKRAAELVVQQAAARHPEMRTSIVRFGNVLASSGSVIPLFKQQLAEGGPITVTHPHVTRYFMTIPEAAELVIQAGAMGQHGEVFLLEMGEPVKIIDLARRLIQLAGLQPKDPATGEGDIAITYTGLRPGEKMVEELLVDGNSSPTGHPRIFRAMDEGVSASVLNRFLGQVQEAIDDSAAQHAATLLLAFAAGSPGTRRPAEAPDEAPHKIVALRQPAS